MAGMAISIPASWLQPAGLKNEGVLGMLLDRSTNADSSRASSSSRLDAEIPAAQPEPDAAAEEVEEVDEEMPGLVADEVEQPEQVAQTLVEAAQTLVVDDDGDMGGVITKTKQTYNIYIYIYI